MKESQPAPERTLALQALLTAVPVAASSPVTFNFNWPVALFAAVLLALVSGACNSTATRVAGAAAPPPGYEKLPENVAAKTYRTMLKVIPYTRRRAFYGNYGGSGNSGGLPVDAMDELFRRHDLVYCHSRSRRILVAADRALVGGLEKLDPATLDNGGHAFRRRAVGFLQSPVSRVIGKPLILVQSVKKREVCPFQSDEDVTAFFDSSRDPPGFGWHIAVTP